MKNEKEEHRMTTKCVLLCCGPPGCGKTIASKEIAAAFAQEGLRPVIISYDDDMDSRLILKDEWNDESFSYNRKIYKELVDAKLKETDVDIVIVDDIMYLCSMRRELYVLARGNNATFLCIQLSAPLSTILHRNSLRECKAKIDDKVVAKLHDAFENVDIKRTAEKHSLVVSTDGDENCQEDRKQLGMNETYLSPELFSKIQHLYFTSIQFQQKRESEHCKLERESSGIDMSHISLRIHNFDLFLRAQIGFLMKSLVSTKYCENLKERVSSVKAEILDTFKAEIKCRSIRSSQIATENLLKKHKEAFQNKINKICESARGIINERMKIS